MGLTPGEAHESAIREAETDAMKRALSTFGNPFGLALSVPLCITHHRAVHSVGNEERWWTEKGIDPIAHAVRLWWDTRHGGVERKDTMAAAETRPPI